MWIRKFFIGVLLVFGLSILSFGQVSLNYPRWISEDESLPGIPSKDLDEYKIELESWSRSYQSDLDSRGVGSDVELSGDAVNAYISQALDIGFYNEVYIDVDGVDESLNMKNYQVRDQMRDLIFLLSLKKSIADWNDRYITQLGTSTVLLSESFQRAFEIYSVYREYVGESSFIDEHNNPILNALLGAGTTSYGNIFESSNLLESYTEGVFINAIGEFASTASKKEAFINSLSLSKADIASLGITFANNVLKYNDAISVSTSVMIENLSTGAFGIASGGLGLVMAPATIFHRSLDYISTGLHQTSQGSHLVNYYYLMKEHTEYSSEFLNSEGQLVDWYWLNAEVCSYQELIRDPISNALCNHNYFAANSALKKEIETAYSIANLFLLVESMDIEKLQQEVVARVKLEYLKDHGFFLKKSYEKYNKYTINIPSTVEDDIDHGVPVTINYYYNDVNIFSNYSGSISNIVYIPNTDLIKSFTFDLAYTEATKVSSDFTAHINYDDGFTRNSQIYLRFNPRINSLELKDMPIDINRSSTYTPSVYLCGDEIKIADLYYKNTSSATNHWHNISLTLLDPIEFENNCRKYPFEMDGYEIFRNTGYGTIEIKVKSSEETSSMVMCNLPDPSDVDKDGIQDDWEILYFFNLDQGKLGDPDANGKNNYQEYLNGIDPTKAGVLGIIETRIVKTYQKVDGTTVSTFYPSGEKWANIVLQSSTLDLDGKTLTIEGNLIIEGGYLKINGGKLIVKGDFIIDKVGEGAYSDGKLIMINASDHILVNGNFVMDSQHDHGHGSDNKYLTAGILEVKGSFIQRGTAGSGAYNFNTSGTHKVILSGNTKQMVSFTNPHSWNGSQFATLELRNSSSEGVEFLTSTYITLDLTASNCQTPLDLSKVTVNGTTNLSASCDADAVIST